MSFLHSLVAIFQAHQNAYLNLENASLNSQTNQEIDKLRKRLEGSLNSHINNNIDIFTGATWKPDATWVAGIAVFQDRTLLSWSLKCEANLPAQAETRAILLGAILAYTRGWRRTSFFIDALEVAQLIKGNRKHPWDFRTPLADLKCKLDLFEFRD